MTVDWFPHSNYSLFWIKRKDKKLEPIFKNLTLKVAPCPLKDFVNSNMRQENKK
jgi:hypothetical protein